MEYNSFYGGRRGASFIIAKSFRLINEEKLSLYEKYIECTYADVTNLPQTGILEFRTPDDLLHTQEYNSFMVQ